MIFESKPARGVARTVFQGCGQLRPSDFIGVAKKKERIRHANCDRA